MLKWMTSLKQQTWGVSRQETNASATLGGFYEWTGNIWVYPAGWLAEEPSGENLDVQYDSPQQSVWEGVMMSSVAVVGSHLWVREEKEEEEMEEEEDKEERWVKKKKNTWRGGVPAVRDPW